MGTSTATAMATETTWASMAAMRSLIKSGASNSRNLAEISPLQEREKKVFPLKLTSELWAHVLTSTPGNLVVMLLLKIQRLSENRLALKRRYFMKQ